MVNSRDGGARTVVTPTTGWTEENGAWVQGTPGTGDHGEVVADAVAALRQGVQPELLKNMLGLASGYTVTGREKVELANGDTASLWAIRADVPHTGVGGQTVTESVIWTDTLGPFVRWDYTASLGGLSGTTTRYWSQWGGDVDLSAIEKLTGRDL